MSSFAKFLNDDGASYYDRIGSKLREVSGPVCDLAKLMEDKLPEGPEKSAGMRKLLEAMDCFVRAAL